MLGTFELLHFQANNSIHGVSEFLGITATASVGPEQDHIRRDERAWCPGTLDVFQVGKDIAGEIFVEGVILGISLGPKRERNRVPTVVKEPLSNSGEYLGRKIGHIMILTPAEACCQ